MARSCVVEVECPEHPFVPVTFLFHYHSAGWAREEPRSNVKNSQRVTLSGVLEHIVPHFHHHHPFDSVEHDHLFLYHLLPLWASFGIVLPLDWGLAKAQISQSGIDTGASCLMNKQQQHVVVCDVMIPLGECWPLLLYQFSFRHWISKCAPIWWPNK